METSEGARCSFPNWFCKSRKALIIYIRSWAWSACMLHRRALYPVCMPVIRIASRRTLHLQHYSNLTVTWSMHVHIHLTVLTLHNRKRHIKSLRRFRYQAGVINTTIHKSINQWMKHRFHFSCLYVWPFVCTCRCHDADMLIKILKEKGVPPEPLADYINAFRWAVLAPVYINKVEFTLVRHGFVYLVLVRAGHSIYLEFRSIVARY